MVNVVSRFSWFCQKMQTPFESIHRVSKHSHKHCMLLISSSNLYRHVRKQSVLLGLSRNCLMMLR